MHHVNIVCVLFMNDVMRICGSVIKNGCMHYKQIYNYK